MGALIGLALAFPPGFWVLFGLLAWDWWFFHLARLPPHEKELYKAAHGMGVIVCGGYLVYTIPLPALYRIPFHYAYAASCCLGVFWLLIGAARAQIYRDASLMTRAVVKFAVGWGFYAFFRHYEWYPYEFAAYWGWDWWMVPVMKSVSIWCWVTAIVQFLISSRRPPRLSDGDTSDVYGGARFRRGRGLQS